MAARHIMGADVASRPLRVPHPANGHLMAGPPTGPPAWRLVPDGPPRHCPHSIATYRAASVVSESRARRRTPRAPSALRERQRPWNVVRPGSESKVIEPSWRSTTMRLARSSPMPVPLPASFVVKNDSKMRGRHAAGIPGPSSETSTTAHCPSRRVVIVIASACSHGPPAGRPPRGRRGPCRRRSSRHRRGRTCAGWSP